MQIVRMFGADVLQQRMEYISIKTNLTRQGQGPLTGDGLCLNINLA